MFWPVKRESRAGYADPFDHIFDQFFEDFGCNRLPAPTVKKVAPQFEIAETDEAYSVAAELPGIDQKEIEVVVDNDILTIRGEKKEEKDEEKKNFLYSERRYGSFERRFRLPETVEQGDISAGFKNGVLTLTLPKKPEARKPEPRKINIK
jgi:HSP20 family protein